MCSDGRQQLIAVVMVGGAKDGAMVGSGCRSDGKKGKGQEASQKQW